MADTTAITIVSVVTAGVIGPGLTALATGRGQRRRFKHERFLHDRDDLRARFDDVATELDALGRDVRIVFNELVSNGPTSHQLSKFLHSGFSQFRRTNHAVARLSLRLDAEGEPVQRAIGSCAMFLRVLELTKAQVAVPDFRQFDSHELAVTLETAERGAVRFLAAGREVLTSGD